MNEAAIAFQDKTKRALLWMSLSHEPFAVLYALLPFILRKDMAATIVQLSILSALKPILPLFSFYWSANLGRKPNHLRSNLIGAWVLARLPFLFFPWAQNVWYLILCCAIYEFFNKSGIPALMEILKLNLPNKTRTSIYTFSFVLSFVESIVLGLGIAWVLDYNPHLWPILFCLATLLGLSSVLLQLAVPIPLQNNDIVVLSLTEKMIKPWKDAFVLLKHDRDFASFQYSFMVGGFALMLIAPSLSIFYSDTLQLSHSSVVTGRSILMGIGIVFTSWFWQSYLTKEHIVIMTRNILFGFSTYLLCLALAQFHIVFFYLAFLLYGIAQAGSHLLWNLSGILFAAGKDSAPFSRLNVLMVGIRGAIAPALGGVLFHFCGTSYLLGISTALCLAGCIIGYLRRGNLAIKYRG